MNIPVIKGWVPFNYSENKVPKETEEDRKKREDLRLSPDKIPKDWKDSFKLEDNPNKRLFALNEYTVIYPRALDKYLQEILPILQKTFQEYHVKVELSVLDGEMKVKSTPKTFDPVILLKAHSVIKVLARYVPVEEALTLLDDDKYEDIILIGHSKKDTFIKRRSRIENDGMKELIKEVLDCKIFVTGKSVVVIGCYSNLHKARKLVTECFEKNIHPIYHMKRFQIMNKLSVLPEMAGKDWSTLLPAIPKKNVKRKEPHKVRKTKEYTPFPPASTESKRDEELRTGVFHLKYTKDGGKYYKKIKKDDKEKKQKFDEPNAKKRKLNNNANDDE